MDAPFHFHQGAEASAIVAPASDQLAPEVLQPSHPFAGLRRAYYRAITIDAPMRFRCRTALRVANWNSRRDIEKHYRTMTFEQLAALPVKDLAHPEGCHLFSWTSGPHLPRTCELIHAWGFKFSTIAFTWVKLRRKLERQRALFLTERDFYVSLGLTTRKGSELVLLGRRGNCRRISKSVRELILAPVREHSRKPDEFYRRVECYCDGPFVDLFARERRPGWDTWGDQVDMFSGGMS